VNEGKKKGTEEDAEGGNEEELAKGEAVEKAEEGEKREARATAAFDLKSYNQRTAGEKPGEVFKLIERILELSRGKDNGREIAGKYLGDVFEIIMQFVLAERFNTKKNPKNVKLIYGGSDGGTDIIIDDVKADEEGGKPGKVVVDYEAYKDNVLSAQMVRAIFGTMAFERANQAWLITDGEKKQSDWITKMNGHQGSIKEAAKKRP